VVLVSLTLHNREFLDNKTKYLAELEPDTREKENYLDFVSTGRARRKSLARIRSKPLLASPRSEGSDSEMSADELLNSMATLSHTLTPTLTHHNTHNSLQVYLSEKDAALGCHASLTETDCLHKQEIEHPSRVAMEKDHEYLHLVDRKHARRGGSLRPCATHQGCQQLRGS